MLPGSQIDVTTSPESTAPSTPCCGPSCCSTQTTEVATVNTDPAAIQAAVREKYDAAARAVAAGKPGSSALGCCGDGTCSDPITADLYSSAETLGLPKDAVLASLGCGNPTALAELLPGEVVLDLGSGGGIDVLLSARRVGPTGKAYGLDQSDEMLALALANKAQAGATNVEFLRGAIENVPLPSETIDVVISNCVVNLSGDKRRTLSEAFRVLKPGGRLAISDVVFLGPVPADLKKSVELWTGCVAGALERSEYLALLTEVGFTEVEIEPTRIYQAEDARAFLVGTDLEPLTERLGELDQKAAAAFVRARKPFRNQELMESDSGRPEAAEPTAQAAEGHETGSIRPIRALFLCTHNSARSQMAEALLRHLGGDQVEVQSAGTVATRVHPLAIAAMAEKGLDLSGHRSKHMDELAGQSFDFVITVCDNARESCPVFPGTPEHIHWSIPDPSAVEGDEETKARAFHRGADELVTRIRHLLALIERKRD